MKYLSRRHLSISGISQLLLSQFFRDHLLQMATVIVTFVQATHCLQHLYISAISQLLLIQFYPTFRTKILGALIFVNQNVWTQHFFRTFFSDQKFFRTQNFYGPQFFLTNHFCVPKYLQILNLFDQPFLRTKISSDLRFFRTKNCFHTNIFTYRCKFSGQKKGTELRFKWLSRY